MEPQQSTQLHSTPPVQPPITPETPQTPPHGPHKNKMLLWILIGMGIILAFALALIVILLTKDSKDSDNSANTSNSSSSNNSDNTGSSVAKSKDIVTVPTQESGVSLTITGINKSGNTLLINYKLNHDSATEEKVYASAYQAGVFVTAYKGTTEPYFVSNADSQKYGLVKDSSNKPLASKDTSAWVKKGESVEGYVTLSLPPNNSTGSLSLGEISIPNVTIKY